MFTGIISDIGTIIKAEQRGDLLLTISCGFWADNIKKGESIACNGACLTVVESGNLLAEEGNKSYFTVQLSSETIARTAPGSWKSGKNVNLERALKLGDALDGHMVSGHVDGVGTITAIEKSGDSHIITVKSPPALSCFIAEKGSITLDGVSLTVNEVCGDSFRVNIIPHTWHNTTLSNRQGNHTINMEVDMIARYAARLLEKGKN